MLVIEVRSDSPILVMMEKDIRWQVLSYWMAKVDDAESCESYKS